jgi:TRAP-type C4-dicarboxylate transport system substrate-binding protein
MTLLSGLVLLLTLLAACTKSSGISLNYSDHDPLGGMRTQFVKDVWLPEIVERSGDQIQVRDFWGGALLSSKEILTGIGDGVTDIGMVFPGHYPRQLIAHSIFSLFPRGPTDFDDMVWLYRKAYAEIPALEAELRKANVLPLMITAGLPGAFSSTHPLGSIDDLQGNKWRAGGKWMLRYLENVGAVPVAVPWGDTYIALQTGTLDGTFANYDGLHMMRFDEVAPHLLVSKELWYAMPFLHLVNATKFEKLPGEIRQALLDASSVAEQRFAATYDEAFESIRVEQLAAGYTVTEISSADLAKWENNEALGRLQSEWVRESEAAGLDNAAEIMEKVRAIHREAMHR